MPVKANLLEQREGHLALANPFMGANRHPDVLQEVDMHDVMLSQGATSQFHLMQEGQMALANTFMGAKRHYEVL